MLASRETGLQWPGSAFMLPRFFTLLLLEIAVVAGFRTHITSSTLVGIGYGAVGVYYFQLPWESCGIAAGLCSLAGMLPDLDSDSGVPVRETLNFVAAVIPLFLLQRLAAWDLTHEQMVLLGASAYFLTRCGLGGLFRRYTVHRGMWHSIPAAVIAGLLAFLLTGSNDVQIRLFKAWAVVLGYLTHLILDELYSVDLAGVRLRLKKSSGTALKLWGDKTWGNVSAYLKLSLLCGLVWLDPTVQAWLADQGIAQPAIARELQQLQQELLPKVLVR